jgi:Immunoglobulin domain/Immunoglobulin I-set domain/Divergent InlB B-repeat domain
MANGGFQVTNEIRNANGHFGWADAGIQRQILPVATRAAENLLFAGPTLFFAFRVKPVDLHRNHERMGERLDAGETDVRRALLELFQFRYRHGVAGRQAGRAGHAQQDDFGGILTRAGDEEGIMRHAECVEFSVVAGQDDCFLVIDVAESADQLGASESTASADSVRSCAPFFWELVAGGGIFKVFLRWRGIDSPHGLSQPFNFAGVVIRSFMNLFPAYRRRTSFAAGVMIALALATGAGFASASTLSLNIAGGGVVSLKANGRFLTNFPAGGSVVLTNGTKCSLAGKAMPGFAFAGWAGSFAGNQSSLTFVVAEDVNLTATFKDKQKPVVGVNYIPGSSALATPSLFIGGTAHDNAAVTNVYCSLTTSPKIFNWQPAASLNGWTSWWSTVTLTPGTNWLAAYAVDSSGLCSGTNPQKLIYTVTPPVLTNVTLIAYTNGVAVDYLNLGTNTFTEMTGVGTYNYKMTSSIFGRLALIYGAPPSATGRSNNVTLPLQFSDATDGTFTDADGVHTFTVQPANGFASPTLNGSIIALNYADGVNVSDLTFLSPPNVVTNTSPLNSNPATLALDADYPGAPGDRVAVTFTHWLYVSETASWVQFPNQLYAGMVVDIGSSNITVLFDSTPIVNKTRRNLVTNAPLQILDCNLTNYVNGSLAAGTSARFTYTNSSPDGSLLVLTQGATSQYVVLFFTNDASAGTFYEEDYSGVGKPPFAVNTGWFGIALPPQITAQPQSVSEVSNTVPVTFSVAAKGTPTLHYQWQFNGTNLTDGTPPWSTCTIAGSTSNSLTISNASTNDIGSYQVVVTNQYGSAISKAAQLTLTPAIMVPPRNITASTNGTAQFSVSAIGIPPLTYQWQQNGNNLSDGATSWGSFISHSTGTNLIITTVNTNDAGNYQVIIGNNYGSVTSSIATLKIAVP